MMVFGVPKLFCATTHVVAALIDISAATRATLTIVFIAMPPRKLRRPYVRTSRQMIEISEIFVPASGALVDLEVVQGDHRDGYPRNLEHHCPPATRVVLHAVDRGHDFDAKRRHAKPNQAAWVGQRSLVDSRASRRH